MFELEGEFVTDKLSLRVRLQATCHNRPIEVALNNWESLTDSVWRGLASLDNTRFPIIWTNAQNMLESSLGDLLTAIVCLTDLAQIWRQRNMVSQAVLAYCFLAGRGKNFPILEL